MYELKCQKGWKAVIKRRILRVPSNACGGAGGEQHPSVVEKKFCLYNLLALNA